MEEMSHFKNVQVYMFNLAQTYEKFKRRWRIEQQQRSGVEMIGIIFYIIGCDKMDTKKVSLFHSN